MRNHLIGLGAACMLSGCTPPEQDSSRFQSAIKSAYDERHGMDYVRLSTTGGMRQGVDVTLDHILWITMTDDGPVIANVELDGVFDKRAERQPLRPPQ